MKGVVIKQRPIVVAGHKTTISLEDDFWRPRRVGPVVTAPRPDAHTGARRTIRR